MIAARVAVVLAGSAFPLILVALGLAEVPRFFDACHTWDAEPGGSLSPSEACRRVAASTEPRGEAVLRLLLVQGSALALVALAWAGTFRWHWPWALWVAAGGLLVLTVPLLLGPAGFLTLAGAVLYATAGFLPPRTRLPEASA